MREKKIWIRDGIQMRVSNKGQWGMKALMFKWIKSQRKGRTLGKGGRGIQNLLFKGKPFNKNIPK